MLQILNQILQLQMVLPLQQHLDFIVVSLKMWLFLFLEKKVKINYLTI